MDNNVCPVCGTELKVSVLDYEHDPRVPPSLLVNYPILTEVIRVTASCNKCKKGRHTSFFKKYLSIDEMKPIARQLFCEEWGKRKDGQSVESGAYLDSKGD